MQKSAKFADFSHFQPISSKRTSPLDVPLYAFGSPSQGKPYSAQFAYSASFFPSPQKWRDCKKTNQSFFTVPFFKQIKIFLKKGLTNQKFYGNIYKCLKFNMRIWRNWQTRMVQVHVKAISCRFKSCYPHQNRNRFYPLFRFSFMRYSYSHRYVQGLYFLLHQTVLHSILQTALSLQLLWIARYLVRG